MNSIQVCYKKRFGDITYQDDNDFTYHLDTGENVFKIYKNIRENRKTVRVISIPFKSVSCIKVDYND